MLRELTTTTPNRPYKLLGYEWGSPPFGPTTQDQAQTHALLHNASQWINTSPCRDFDELTTHLPLPLLFLEPSTYPKWRHRPEAQKSFIELEREHLAQMNDYERSILCAVARGDVMPFDIFFNISNYGAHGVYTSEGAAQKLFTSTPRSNDLEGGYFDTASKHPQFAEAFARYAFQQWELAGKPDEFTFCEMGAGNGNFAENFLRTVQRFAVDSEGWKKFSRALRYHIVEMSGSLIEYQRQRLAAACPQVSFTQSNAYSGNLPHIRIGIFFSNELLDMLPPRQIICDQDVLEEVFILNGGCLLHKVGVPLRRDSEDFLKTFDITIPSGKSLYIQPDIPRYIHNMRRYLEDGVIIACDYGRERPELLALHNRACRRYFAPEITFRLPGDLSNHPLNISFPGDLTVDVDFTLLKAAFESLGFTVSDHRQTQFIKDQLGRQWLDSNLQSITEGCSVFIGK